MPFSPCDASCSSSTVLNKPSACCASATPPPPPPPPPSTSLTAAKTPAAPEKDSSSLAVPAPPPMETNRERKRQSSPEEGKQIVTNKPRTCSLPSPTVDNKPVNDDTKDVAAAASSPRNIDVSVELVLFDKSWITADSLPIIEEELDDVRSKDQASESELKKMSINLAKFRHYSAVDIEEERQCGVSTKLSLSLV